ncbi:hypothetical protein AB205_0011330 [Aquarana catesbeiana]|uniref:Uncharacterized protein n=1 Tax=Aquarana catesbeiana TaxID=8400 RepID=A0A2G9SK04_AQUCT|nr:hypothetical protein AB205_0011330 [Aquarana catesbeiana]
MPFLDLDTNIPQQDIADDFTEKLCSAAASILSKPKEDSAALSPSGALADWEKWNRYDIFVMPY